jgi:hypothetical protein
MRATRISKKFWNQIKTDDMESILLTWKMNAKKKAFITLCSPVVPLLSTSKADGGLASEFRWDRAIYTTYERMLKVEGKKQIPICIGKGMRCTQCAEGRNFMTNCQIPPSSNLMSFDPFWIWQTKLKCRMLGLQEYQKSFGIGWELKELVFGSHFKNTAKKGHFCHAWGSRSFDLVLNRHGQYECYMIGLQVYMMRFGLTQHFFVPSLGLSEKKKKGQKKDYTKARNWPIDKASYECSTILPLKTCSHSNWKDLYRNFRVL